MFLDGVFTVVIVALVFDALAPLRPSPGEFAHGLWFLLVDVGTAALSLATPGVGGAALIVLALVGWLFEKTGW